MEKVDRLKGRIFHPFVLSSIIGFLFIAVIFIAVTHSQAQVQIVQKEPPLTPVLTLRPTSTPVQITHAPTPMPTLEPTKVPTSTPNLTPSPTLTPTPKPTADPNEDSVWDRLAQCESGGNWKEDTGNSYFGGLQFNQSAWESVGGTGKASDASREDQIAKGKLLQQRRGWGPWGGCSKELGLF